MSDKKDLTTKVGWYDADESSEDFLDERPEHDDWYEFWLWNVVTKDWKEQALRKDLLNSESTGATLADVEQKMSSIEEDLLQEQEQTRSRIGTVFVRWFFGFLLFGFVWVMIYNIAMYAMTSKTDLFLDITKVITLVGSVIGTPLWFVMGYYFKEGKA